ncbi:MAG: hypothetical protein ACTFAL_02375 [Candidatus Electronema sp. V4]|uniref:hypothetical protein n=1 Tax=Candidatus Electronema sp. V4 TaxID=3454756 RepID=UPI00405540D6
MRCPKCGYISFDQLETCGGCKKNIAKFSKDFSGVVFKSESPDFLWFQRQEEEVPEEEEPEGEVAVDEESDGVDFGLDAEGTADADSEAELAAATEDGGLDIAADEPQEIEFDLSADSGAGEEPEPEAPKEEIAFELPGMEDTASEPEIGKKEQGLDLSLEQSGEESSGLDSLDLGLDFDLDDSAAAAPPVKPEKAAKSAAKEQPPAKSAKKESPLDLDLGSLDLSGLMPPAEEESKVDFSFSGLGELSLEDAPPAKGERTPGKKTAGGKSKGADDALPDLAMEGLDLDTPILPPTASVAGKKMRPAAKTGTALDEFNIDLGDLLGGGKK